MGYYDYFRLTMNISFPLRRLMKKRTSKCPRCKTKTEACTCDCEENRNRRENLAIIIPSDNLEQEETVEKDEEQDECPKPIVSIEMSDASTQTTDNEFPKEPYKFQPRKITNEDRRRSKEDVTQLWRDHIEKHKNLKQLDYKIKRFVHNPECLKFTLKRPMPEIKWYGQAP